MRQIPVDAKRKDWPRIVAQRTNETARRVETLQRDALTRAKLRFVA